MFLSKKCKNTHRKPISIKKTFIGTEIKEEKVKIVKDEELFEDKEETLTLINKKTDGVSIEETIQEEDLKKKTKKKNNKE